MSPLSYVGLPISILFLLQTTTPQSGVDPFLETLKNAVVILGGILLPILADYVRRTRKEQKEAEAKTPSKQDVKDVADHARDESAKLLGKITELQKEQERTNNIMDQLTIDLNETREERDKFKADWAKELTEHSSTKLRLTEEVNTNKELVSVNIEKHEVNEKLQERLLALEKKVETYQPIEALSQFILSNMTNAVTAGMVAYYASLTHQTGEHIAVLPVPTPEAVVTPELSTAGLN